MDHSNHEQHSITRRAAPLPDFTDYCLPPVIAALPLQELPTLKALEQLAASFPEINPANYNEDDVARLNQWGIDTANAIDAHSALLRRAAA